MPAPTVRVERAGPVTTVMLARPEVRNAVDRPTAEALADAFRAFDADPDAAVAVLWGEGGAFCSGTACGPSRPTPSGARRASSRERAGTVTSPPVDRRRKPEVTAESGQVPSASSKALSSGCRGSLHPGAPPPAGWARAERTAPIDSRPNVHRDRS
nr:hypothetical protein GCM10020241_29630 [Streptoalloteichus tenebrarius]